MVIDDNWTHFVGFYKKIGHEGLIVLAASFEYTDF